MYLASDARNKHLIIILEIKARKLQWHVEVIHFTSAKHFLNKMKQ